MTDTLLFPISRMARDLGPNAIRDLLKLLEKPDIISFAGGIPDPRLFPRDAVANAFDVALHHGSADVLQYGATLGSDRLRHLLAEKMRAQGIPCGPENIIVATGSQQALDLAVRVLHYPGDQILVDNPTYLGALQTFHAADARLVTDPVTAIGGRISLSYHIPDFANPTGRTMSTAGRTARLDTATKGGFAIIEDAAYAELHYDAPAEPSILALDCARQGSIERARTIYCGTFSKTLVPGLRVGWACGPSEVIAKMGRMKECADILSAPVNQEIAAQLLETVYGAHVDKLRTVYGARRDAALEALTTHMPDGVSWTEPGGGMFIWLTLPDHLDASALLPRVVEEAGVAYVPGRHFIPDQSTGNHLRISFCLYDPDRTAEGLGKLGRFLGDVC